MSQAVATREPPDEPQPGADPPAPPPGPLERLTRLQTRRPVELLVAVLLTAIFCGWLATKLKLKTSFGDLLPRGKRSVIVADAVAKRLPAISTFIVVAEGSDDKALERFVDRLKPELGRLPKQLVESVDADMKDTQRFFEERKLLYAPLDLIQTIHHDVAQRYEYEIAQQTGSWIDDDEVPPPLTEESLKKRIDAKTGKAASAANKFPDGYYLDSERHSIAIRILTPLSSGDVEQTAELLRLTREAVARARPSELDPTMRVGYSGNIITSAEVHDQIVSDSAHVGLWGVSLILGVILVYFMRLRTLVAMGLTAAIGVAWTFGMARWTVGYLDQSTSFSFSIVVGNGINFGIIYMARYLEERREHGVPESILAAHRGTWAATLTVAAAATAAYGSLSITDFRGFKHFGLIGGTGMLLCWLATFIALPAFLALSEHIWPLGEPNALVARITGVYGKPFAWIVERGPRLVVAAGVLVTVGATALALRYVRGDPMEYNMENVDNKPVDKTTEARRLMDMSGSMLPRLGLDGIALAVDDIADVQPLARALETRRDAAARPPFGSVVTVFSFLPTDQPKKIELLRDIRATIERAWKKRFVSDADWKKLDELMPEKALAEIGIADLPEAMARPFTEVDGARGRLLYLEPAEGRSVWDAHYLIEWADSFRVTELSNGKKIEGSGQSVVFADMILAIVEDAPKAILVSLVATVILVVAAFRGRRHALAVIASLLVGFVWTVAVMAVAKSRWPWEQGGFALEPMRLNFLNFIALPITIGVGSDYAVNVMKRYELDGGDIRRAIVETGGAVVLCSLTTMLGYFALTLSVNLAIKSFGVAAAAGEVCCIVSAVLLLPACLALLRRRSTEAK